MSLLQPSNTMQAVCAVRFASDELAENDPISKKIYENLPDAKKHKEALDAYSNGMFSRSVTARSLFFKKMLDTNINYSQLIVLSYGLDFRCINHFYWKDKPKFLIDHPKSMELSVSLIKDHMPAFTDTQIIPMDFVEASDGLIQKELLKFGFDTNKSTLIIWEGSTYYLDKKVIYKILENVSHLGDEVKIIFDCLNETSYLTRRRQEDNLEQTGLNKTLKYIKDIKEPWVGYLSDNEIKDFFTSQGFSGIEIFWDNEVEMMFFNENKMNHKSIFYVDAAKSKIKG